MRGQQEIVEMIEKRKQIPLDFWQEVLVNYLTFGNAKPYLIDEATESDWTRLTDPMADMKSYMEFAWEKASDHRGLSAGRSVNKMQAWLWLMEDPLWQEIGGMPYKNYGAPILLAICKKHDLSIPDDEGVLRMSIGCKCRDGCEEGCA